MRVLGLVFFNFITVQIFLVVHGNFQNCVDTLVELLVLLHHNHLLKLCILLEGLEIEIFVESIDKVLLDIHLSIILIITLTLLLLIQVVLYIHQLDVEQ